MQNIRERNEAKRQAIIDNLLHCIENNPRIWEKGWYSVTDFPLNGKSNKKYQGFNALYLSLLASMKGYNDPRWMTFNQVKEMGGYVNAGEKSSEIFFYTMYDKNTKKEFDEKTVEGMTVEERNEYMDKNVYKAIKFYQVFNATQCKGLPEYNKPQMSDEEQTKQINLIENVIKNSAAPISYDGGSNAYYNTATDSIHLPKVSDFKTMQDYYATALHEIAHSTGHTSRLNRDLNGGFGSESYAVEELRAELSSVFMQLDLGLQLEGQHIENHGAYLSSWLKAVKNDKNILFKTIRDAEKISDYVVENYAQEIQIEEVVAENAVFETNTSFAMQVDAVLNGDMSKNSDVLISKQTPFALRIVGLENRYMLMHRRHIVNAHKPKNEHLHTHGLTAEQIKKLPEILENPTMIFENAGTPHSDRIVVVSNYLDNDNCPIIAAIQPNGEGRYEGKSIKPSNFIVTMFGKDNFNRFLQTAIDENRVLFWDKEKTQTLYRELSHQLPQALYKVEPDIIIRKAKAFVNSFSQEIQNNSDKLGNKSETLDLQKYNEPYRSYLQEKGNNPEVIYFKRIGDFYEVMGENAKIIAEELDLTLTSRKIGQEERVPMCGIPYHALDNYLKKLNDKYTADIKENGIYLTSIKTQEKQSQQVEQAKQVGQVEQVEANSKANNYVVIDLQFNYSNEMLFSNELQKMGFHHDFSIQSENDERDTYAFEEQIPYWTNEIKYTNSDNSKIISGIVGRVSNGIIVESTDITRFYLTNFTNSEVEQFVNILNNFGVASKVKLLDKEIEQVEQENDLTTQEEKIQEKPVMIPSQVKGWSDWSIDEIKNDEARKAAEWLLANKYENEQDVKEAFYNRQTSSMSDDFNAYKNDEIAIVEIAKKYQIKTQEKQSQQVEQAKQVGQAEQVEYLKIDIPKEQYGGEYGKSVMIKMPKGSEYSSFVFFAPKNFVKQQNSNGDYILTVKNTSLCELKNDGMSVELTGKELSTAIAGEKVGKSAKRVAPSHRTVNNLERINSNIPDEMKNKPNWCVYKARWNSEKGKKDKYIYSPILGLDEKGKLQWASIDKPDTWSTFDRALEFARENNCEGLVFALDGSGISCIDLDKAIVKNGFLNGKATDLKDGELNDIAKKIVPNMSDTYIEKSTSGNGFHIFVRDDILKGNHYKNRAELENGDEIEVYDNKRFISMTGDCDSKKDLSQCPQETMSYIRTTLGKKQTVNYDNYDRSSSSSYNKSDAEVIATIEKSKKGSVFKQLYSGVNITGDNSRNDFMLMNILAYFTDCDAEQMERIFKSSGLYRPQKQDGYYKTTINNAIGSLYQKPNFGSKPFGKSGGKKNNNSK